MKNIQININNDNKNNIKTLIITQKQKNAIKDQYSQN